MKMNDEPDEVDVATNRILAQSMVSKKAWADLEKMTNEDIRIALESLIVTGLLSEVNGQYSVTETGKKVLGEEDFL
jgi:hypothetical protein